VAAPTQPVGVNPLPSHVKGSTPTNGPSRDAAFLPTPIRY
jgi:hypothetical protein